MKLASGEYQAVYLPSFTPLISGTNQQKNLCVLCVLAVHPVQSKVCWPFIDGTLFLLSAIKEKALITT